MYCGETLASLFLCARVGAMEVPAWILNIPILLSHDVSFAQNNRSLANMGNCETDTGKKDQHPLSHSNKKYGRWNKNRTGRRGNCNARL